MKKVKEKIPIEALISQRFSKKREIRGWNYFTITRAKKRLSMLINNLEVVELRRRGPVTVQFWARLGPGGPDE